MSVAATASLKSRKSPSIRKPSRLRRRATETRPRMDLAILIDTTGQMGVYFKELRRTFMELIHELRTATIEPRLGIIAYKDHGAEGEDSHYLTLEHPFSSQLSTALDFLNDAPTAPGLGGGGAEALECALRSVNGFSWRPEARKLVVTIGDKPPHGGGIDGFEACTHHVDYRDEVEELQNQDARLYTIQVGRVLETRRVYEWMSAGTGGAAISLTKPGDLPQVLSNILHRECGDLQRYQRKLHKRGALSESQRRLLLPLSA